MNRLFRSTLGAFLLFLAVFPLGGCGTPRPGKSFRLRVLSYNIRHGLGMDGKWDLDRLAEAIGKASPDLVALQEVDQGTRRSKGLDEVRFLAEKAGFFGAFGKAMNQHGGEYGEGLLSRKPLLAIEVHHLPAAKGYEPRALLEGRVRPWKDGPEILFFGTHLDHLSEAQRLAQAKEINRIVKHYGDTPMILAGDMNALSGGPTMKEFFREWTPAALGAGPTFPADKPSRKIDYVLFRPASRWKVLHAQVLEEALASDHRPLLVVLELLPPGGGREEGKAPRCP